MAERFLQEAQERCARAALSFNAEAYAALQSYRWPGNVRELRNRIERAAALSPQPVLGASDLFSEDRLCERSLPTLGLARERAELQQIELALEQSGGRLAEAAKRLGVSRTTLWKRLKKFDVE